MVHYINGPKSIKTDRVTRTGNGDRPTDKADYRDAGACSSQHLKIGTVGCRVILLMEFPKSG